MKKQAPFQVRTKADMDREVQGILDMLQQKYEMTREGMAAVLGAAPDCFSQLDKILDQVPFQGRSRFLLNLTSLSYLPAISPDERTKGMVESLEVEGIGRKTIAKLAQVPLAELDHMMADIHNAPDGIKYKVSSVCMVLVNLCNMVKAEQAGRIEQEVNQGINGVQKEK